MSRANAQTCPRRRAAEAASRTGLACLRNATTGDGFCTSHRRRLWLGQSAGVDGGAGAQQQLGDARSGRSPYVLDAGEEVIQMTGLITKLRTAIHVLKSVTTLLRHAVQLIQALQTAQSSWAAARA